MCALINCNTKYSVMFYHKKQLIIYLRYTCIMYTVRNLQHSVNCDMLITNWKNLINREHLPLIETDSFLSGSEDVSRVKSVCLSVSPSNNPRPEARTDGGDSTTADSADKKYHHTMSNYL